MPNLTIFFCFHEIFLTNDEALRFNQIKEEKYSNDQLVKKGATVDVPPCLN